jgi:hypothetical protein
MRCGIALTIALLATDALSRPAVEYRWTSGPGTGGTITAAIENRAGSAFRIYCSTGGTSPQGGFEYETRRTKLRENERIQVVVGKKSFVLSAGPNQQARGSRIELARLVREMISTGAKSFLVEVPRANSVERFSLKDAAQHLKDDSGSIYEPCA